MSKETSSLSMAKGIVGNIKNSIIELINSSDNEQVFNLAVEINDYLEDILDLVKYLENDRNKLIGENTTISKLNDSLVKCMENASKEAKE